VLVTLTLNAFTLHQHSAAVEMFQTFSALCSWIHCECSAIQADWSDVGRYATKTLWTSKW